MSIDSHNPTLPYNKRSLSSLHGLDVVVSQHVPDDKMVFRQANPNSSAFASYKLTIWDLKTGQLSGNADPAHSTELHMSEKRFSEVKVMVDEPPEERIATIRKEAGSE